MMSKPLTFGELSAGEHFIVFPLDGDDSGHGGYRESFYLFRKIMPAVKLLRRNEALHRTVSIAVSAGIRITNTQNLN